MSFVYDSGDPTTHSFVDVFVKNDDIGVLQCAGLSDGEEIPILMGVGPKAGDFWAPYAMNGVYASLRPDNTQLLLDARGWYRLDVGSAFAARVRVHYESMERHLIARTPHPFTDAQDPCADLPARGRINNWSELS